MWVCVGSVVVGRQSMSSWMVQWVPVNSIVSSGSRFAWLHCTDEGQQPETTIFMDVCSLPRLKEGKRMCAREKG